jgi:two-component system sensor histidine kinase KdpD
MVKAVVARDLGETRRSRGRYKIFLGMSAGVGKTYRMLQEGQAAAEDGRDVTIGYLEPHGRAETLAQAEVLEVIPRRTVRYRDVTMTEMDLPGVLRRAPELCLIDELAHTNAPGVEHRKRYEDIADVLTAGIDVYSTVNVQHLESLNDQVAELTEIRVRETVPDSILASADDVVLIDITPDSLLERLRAGKVYPPERVQSALNNFFKVENLTALREVSLRQVAEEIEAKRLPPPMPAASGGPSTRRGAGRDDERLLETHAPSAIGERLLALVTPQPASQRVVRRAWRSAQRLGAELDLLWVTRREPHGDEVEQLEALRRLAGVLGAHLLIEHGTDIAEIAARIARERGTTYVLMGRPSARSALRRLSSPALPGQLMNMLPGVDLRIVADRSQRQEYRS